MPYTLKMTDKFPKEYREKILFRRLSRYVSKRISSVIRQAHCIRTTTQINTKEL